MVETPADSQELTYRDDYQPAESQDIKIVSSPLRHSLSLTRQWISKSQQQLLIKLSWMESLLDIVA